jgi:hypothetical protein
VVSRSLTTDEMDTFIIDVSTTRTNIAIASSVASRRLSGGASVVLVTTHLTLLLASLDPSGPSATDTLADADGQTRSNVPSKRS